VKKTDVNQKAKKDTRNPANQHTDQIKTTVVIRYVHGLSEAVTRVYKRYGIPTSTRPFQSIRSLLVHPKDKVNPDHKMSVNVSTKYHAGTVTSPTLGKPAERLV